MNFITKLKGKVKKTKSEKKADDVESDYDIFIERPRLNFFIKLYYMIVKNLHLLIRSKFSGLIYILGPLLIIFLVALSFNTSTLYDLNIAVYSDAYSNATMAYWSPNWGTNGWDDGRSARSGRHRVPPNRRRARR